MRETAQLDQQIPSPDELSTPAIDALVALRPKAAIGKHIELGRYGDVIASWKAQTRLLRARMVSEVRATRLGFSSGAELRELAHSEYNVDIDETPGFALGNVILQRLLTNTNPGTTGNFPRGVIPAGFRVRKVADPTASPPVLEAGYETVTVGVIDDVESSPPTDLGGGNWEHFQILALQIRADRAGDHANVPVFVAEAPQKFEASDALFDPSFLVTIGFAAGGYLSLRDETVRRIAGANFLGQFGPTTGALLALALSTQGAEHVALVENTTTAITRMFAADGSWGSAPYFLDSLVQSAKNKDVGFGCRFETGKVSNQRTIVTATVLLVDPKYSSETVEITTAVQKALRSYFDDRPDWYTWKHDTIGAVIAGADYRILTCTVVTLSDGSGNVLSEPPGTPDPTSDEVTHYYLAADAVRITYLNPS